MWAKSLAALLLGLPLAVVVTSLAAFFGPGVLAERTLPALLMVFPTWVAAGALAFWFRRGWQAWTWMGGAVVAGAALLHWAKGQGWVVLVA